MDEAVEASAVDTIASAEQDLAIEVGSDSDSAFGGSETSSTTTSLASSVFDYVYEVRWPLRNHLRYTCFRQN